MVSTSAGRLFDAVSAILGVRKASTFEGEASTTLQFLADAFSERSLAEGVDPEMAVDEVLEQYPQLLSMMETEACPVIATDALVRVLVEEKLAGRSCDMLSYWFHSILARQIVHCSRNLAKQYGSSVCALTGGVFQNQLLLRLCDEGLRKAGLKVYRHSLIPPNDGGLALGQAVAAMYHLNQEISC